MPSIAPPKLFRQVPLPDPDRSQEVPYLSLPRSQDENQAGASSITPIAPRSRTSTEGGTATFMSLQPGLEGLKLREVTPQIKCCGQLECRLPLQSNMLEDPGTTCMIPALKLPMSQKDPMHYFKRAF